ncbi:MAG: HAMP domain-containing protein [Caldilineaceae bacterium]|nr:HAMP domain-containing protein [Caldilineaceae bacterium]
MQRYGQLRQAFQQWLEEGLIAVSGVNVSVKILGIVLALTVALGLGVTLQVRSVMTETLLAELNNLGHSVTGDLAARSVRLLQNADYAGLQELLAETVENHSDARYAFIVEDHGQVLAHTFADGVSTELLALTPPLPIPYEYIYESYEGPIHGFAEPIFPDGRAFIRLGFAESRLQAIIDRTTQRMLLTTLYVALAGVLAAALLTWLLTRPILDLVKTTNRVRQGDLTARAPHWTDDEIGKLADAFNQMIEELEASQQAVIEKEAARDHLLSRLIEAQEDERKRIARDLHDDVGQALTSVLVNLKMLEQSSEEAQRQQRFDLLRQTVNETLTSVRLLSRQLRPSALDDLGLAAALERYSSEFSSRYPQLTVDLHCSVTNRLPAAIETSLYRIIQEAMTNTARHSGASTVSVLVTEREGRMIQAIIEDDGHGFAVEALRRAGSSVGLHSMAERTQLLGGQLDIESNSGGTSVYVEIPL